MERKLKIELVPDSCWYSNLRTLLPKKYWDAIKASVKARAGGRCEICGRETGRLEAHEQWIYDEKNCIQKLDNVIAVCKDCHSAIHFGRTQLLGNPERAEDHYMKVNGISYAEMKSDIKKANEDHIRRNKIPEWKLDVSKISDIIK